MWLHQTTMNTSAETELAGKLIFTLYIIYFVLEYSRNYGWKNFLYFCDVALIVVFVAVCAPLLREETKLMLISAAACGIVLPQMFWIYDFLMVLTDLPLLPRLGLASYMLNEKLPAHLRLLSTFHVALPVFLLFYMMNYGGYHDSGFAVWSSISLFVVLVSYAVSPRPSKEADAERLPLNINYVYGWDNHQEQRVFSRAVWLLVLNGLLTALYLASHVALKWAIPRIN